jgi:hypothetical protein
LPLGSSVEVIVLDNRADENIVDRYLIAKEKSTDPARLEYLVNVSSLMNEWESAADEFAYQDL